MFPASWSLAATNAHNYRRSSRFLLCGWNNDSLSFYYCSNGFTFWIPVILLIMAKGVLFSIRRTPPYIPSRAAGCTDRLRKLPRYSAEPLKDAAVNGCVWAGESSPPLRPLCWRHVQPTPESRVGTDRAFLKCMACIPTAFLKYATFQRAPGSSKMYPPSPKCSTHKSPWKIKCISKKGELLGCPVVSNLPCNAGDTGLIPGQKDPTRHRYWPRVS